MRRGSTLIEMAVTIAIAGIILAGAADGVSRLRRLADVDTAAGTRLEWACIQLRRDLATGRAAAVDGGLRIARDPAPPVRWRVEDGQLLRDGRLMARVGALAIEDAGGGVAVILSPTGLPQRRIEGGRR